MPNGHNRSALKAATYTKAGERDDNTKEQWNQQ
jgi:hypothetical protein